MTMSKLWVIGTAVYRTEAAFKKELMSRTDDTSYSIFEEVTTGTAYDIKKEQDINERDLQIRTIIDEISPKERAMLELIKLYNNYVNEGKGSQEILKSLVGLKTKPTSFIKIIQYYKEHLINITLDIEWHTTLLRCNNFRDYKVQPPQIQEVINPELLDVFNKAKKIIKNK